MKQLVLVQWLRSFGVGFGVATVLAVFPAGLTAQGTVVWDGPTITYTQPDDDPTQEANQDRLTSAVWLTRANRRGLFNAVAESSYISNLSPADTEWAYGQLADYATLTYQVWEVWNDKNPPSMVGRPAVLHLISDDIYLSIQFTFWEVMRQGGFSYTRSTPVAVPEPAALSLLGTGLAALVLRRRMQAHRGVAA